MIIVHHLNNSRSQRVLWLLEELDVPYDLRRYQRNPETMLAPPELKAAHRLGKSPVVVDGDLTLAESGANELTAADIQMSFPLELSVVRAGLDDKRPRLMEWLRRIHARRAYQRALERGGKYDYANA